MLFKRNTRQKILIEAFSVCEEQQNVSFSLSEVAKRVGISKAAIFRHFKNKVILLEEMRKKFWEDFSKLFNDKLYFFGKSDVEKISYEEFLEFMTKIIFFLFDNPGYYDTFYNSIVKNSIDIDLVFKICRNGGVEISDSFFKKIKKCGYFKGYFCNAAIFYFVSRKRGILQKKIACKSDVEINESLQDFSKRITDYLWNGIANTVEISPQRISELNELCKLSFIEHEERTKFFKAFAEVFNEYGIKGITVEKISERLNLAKSSLYSYFNNKNEFIERMVVEEICSLINILEDKVQYAQTLQELVYIILRAEKNYLEQRPIVLMIHVWAIKNNYAFSKNTGNCTEVMNKFLDTIRKKNIEVSGLLDVRTFVGWICAECGFFKIFLETSLGNFIEKDSDYADELFSLVINGIK